MKAKCIIILSTVAAASFGLGWFTNSHVAKKKAKSDKKAEPEKATANAESNYNQRAVKKKKAKSHMPKQEQRIPVGDEFPLQPGSEGKRVERLQVWLMRNYGHTGKINGIYDEKTDALVKRFLKTDRVDEALFYEMGMGKPVHEQTLMK